MYTTIRIYRGAPGLAGALVARSSEVGALMQDVDGFESYQLLRTFDGAVSVTTCQDREGVEASTRIAAGWLRSNLPNLVATPPEVIQGESVLNLGRSPVPA